MRLLEHRRQALGLREAEPTRWRTRLAAPMAHVIVEEHTAARQGAVLVTHVNASPEKGLIPGAVVTVSLASTNEGTAPTSPVKIGLPLPREASFQAGSLQIDGRPARESESEAFFGTGLDVGVLAPGQRKTLVFKIGVGAGLRPLALMAHVSAPRCAVVGPRGLSLERSSAAQGFTRLPAEPEPPAETPFYELDPQETVEAEALDAILDAAAMPTATEAASLSAGGVLEPSEPAAPSAPFSEHLSAVLAAPLAPLPVPAAATPVATPPVAAPPVAEPSVAAPPVAVVPPVVEPSVAAPPIAAPRVAQSPISAPPPPSRAAPAADSSLQRLYAAVPCRKLATLRQFFVPERSFGITAHYLLATALACSRTGDDTAPLAAFMDAQERLLTRAMIARKMGRPVHLEDLAAPLPPFPSEGASTVPQASEEALVLVRDLTPADRVTLAGATGNVKSPAFIRAAQLAVGLVPTKVLYSSDPAPQQKALAAYAAGAAGEINRLFVRSRLDRRADLFGASSPELDALARALLEILSLR